MVVVSSGCGYILKHRGWVEEKPIYFIYLHIHLNSHFRAKCNKSDGDWKLL